MVGELNPAVAGDEVVGVLIVPVAVDVGADQLAVFEGVAVYQGPEAPPDTTVVADGLWESSETHEKANGCVVEDVGQWVCFVIVNIV